MRCGATSELENVRCILLRHRTRRLHAVLLSNNDDSNFDNEIHFRNDMSRLTRPLTSFHSVSTNWINKKRLRFWVFVSCAASVPCTYIYRGASCIVCLLWGDCHFPPLANRWAEPIPISRNVHLRLAHCNICFLQLQLSLSLSPHLNQMLYFSQNKLYFIQSEWFSNLTLDEIRIRIRFVRCIFYVARLRWCIAKQ